MSKRLLIVISLLLVTVGCVKKEYKFNLSNDVVIIDQSLEEFSNSMLEDVVTLTYGEDKQSLETVTVEGNINLEKIGNYPVTLLASHKGQSASTEVVISVIDRQKPELHIFENELLVHIDEELEINASNFLINLTDGINGQISSRIKVVGEYNLDEVGSYEVTLNGSDEAGNEVSEEITIRVTDIIDEKAQYLYKKAITVARGEAYVFKNNDKKAEIINLEDSLAIFTPTHSSQFLWFSGINGDYKPKQSGAKLTLENGNYYADYSGFDELKGYKNTNLKLQQEVENYRHYVAESTYGLNGEEEVKLTKFSIRKIDGVWLVDEFYLQY